jgi:hypothetical protein
MCCLSMTLTLIALVFNAENRSGGVQSGGMVAGVAPPVEDVPTFVPTIGELLTRMTRTCLGEAPAQQHLTPRRIARQPLLAESRLQAGSPSTHLSWVLRQTSAPVQRPRGRSRTGMITHGISGSSISKSPGRGVPNWPFEAADELRLAQSSGVLMG